MNSIWFYYCEYWVKTAIRSDLIPPDQFLMQSLMGETTAVAHGGNPWGGDNKALN